MGEKAVLERMRQQHGIVSRSQALAAGMTLHQIDYRVRSGHWVNQVRGVYRHAAVPTTPLARLLAACLAYRGLASRRSAAAVHGIDGYEFGVVELVVPTGKGRAVKGVCLHESSQFDLADPVVRNAIPCTGLARTVLDLATMVSRSRLERTVDAVLRDGCLRLSDLYGVLVAHARRGRKGCSILKACLDDRFGDLAVPLSEWSRMVADLLVGAGLEYPALEHPVVNAGGDLVGRVDLAYPAHRVAIELDSARWHDNRESFVNDRRRRNDMTVAGWDVLNFTWKDYAGHPQALCDTVLKALHPAGVNCL